MWRVPSRRSVPARVAGCILLSILLGFQFYVGSVRRPDITLFDDIPSDNYTAADFNRTFPWETGDYDASVALEAASFFHLPTWSRSYRACEHHSEISCYELIRAYLHVSDYLAQYKSDQLVGYLAVNLPLSAALHCRISTLYNAFLIGLFTRRRIVLIANASIPTWLREYPHSLFQVPPAFPKKFRNIPHNYTFPCQELMLLDEVIELSGCMWPQVSYIHTDLAPKVRSVFGFHAAYYILNLLVDIDKTCSDVEANVTIGATHRGYDWHLGEREFASRAVGCEGNHRLLLIEEDERDNDDQLLWKMRQMIGADKIIYAFGSVISWAAMAMQGKKGAVVELDGANCIELRNSQSGSIIHTYNPRKFFHYSTNNDFLVCGPNYNDARLFMRYLLW
jgi:hypothetical protein